MERLETRVILLLVGYLIGTDLGLMEGFPGVSVDVGGGGGDGPVGPDRVQPVHLPLQPRHLGEEGQIRSEKEQKGLNKANNGWKGRQEI